MSPYRSTSSALRHRLASAACLCILIVAPLVQAFAAQRTVRVTAARVEIGAAGSATAYLTVENGTMYEVYLLGATTDVADTVELMQYSANSTAPVKEVAIPAFDRLEMSSRGVFVKLTDLKRSLKPGEDITITLKTDSGEELSVTAAVK